MGGFVGTNGGRGISSRFNILDDWDPGNGFGNGMEEDSLDGQQSLENNEELNFNGRENMLEGIVKEKVRDYGNKKDWKKGKQNMQKPTNQRKDKGEEVVEEVIMDNNIGLGNKVGPDQRNSQEMVPETQTHVDARDSEVSILGQTKTNNISDNNKHIVVVFDKPKSGRTKSVLSKTTKIETTLLQRTSKGGGRPPDRGRAMVLKSRKIITKNTRPTKNNKVYSGLAVKSINDLRLNIENMEKGEVEEEEVPLQGAHGLTY